MYWSLQAPCLFRRVDMIFFCFTFQTVVLWQNCHGFQPWSSPCRVWNHIFTVLYIVCCSRKTQIITSFILSLPRFPLKCACTLFFLVKPCVCLAYFFQHEESIPHCWGFLNFSVWRINVLLFFFFPAPMEVISSPSLHVKTISKHIYVYVSNPFIFHIN